MGGMYKPLRVHVRNTPRSKSTGNKPLRLPISLPSLSLDFVTSEREGTFFGSDVRSTCQIYTQRFSPSRRGTAKQEVLQPLPWPWLQARASSRAVRDVTTSRLTIRTLRRRSPGRYDDSALLPCLFFSNEISVRLPHRGEDCEMSMPLPTHDVW